MTLGLNQEEKLIGKRHAYDTLPLESIKACLNAGNITLDDIDRFVIGWDFEKIYKMLGKEFLTKEEVSKFVSLAKQSGFEMIMMYSLGAIGIIMLVLGLILFIKKKVHHKE